MEDCETCSLGHGESTGEIPPFYFWNSNPDFSEARRGTVLAGQFDWGGFLPKSNGGARRYSQHGWQPCLERIGRRVLDCETDRSSRYESRPK